MHSRINPPQKITSFAGFVAYISEDFISPISLIFMPLFDFHNPVEIFVEKLIFAPRKLVNF